MCYRRTYWQRIIVFLFIITFVSSHTTLVKATSSYHDMQDVDSYNFRIDGVANFSNLQISDSADIDEDGENDIVIGAYGADYNGRSASGSLFIIYGSLFKTLSANKTINLSNPANYNIRFDGASSEDWVGYISIYRAFQDVNSDGKIDLLISCSRGDANSRNRSGSMYVVYNSFLRSKVGTGNILDLANGNNYNLRFDGPKATSLFGYVPVSADVNGNGINDLLVNSAYGQTNNSGSLYIFFDSYLSNFQGTGNNIDLLNPANFNIRYDGVNSTDYFSQGNVLVGDVDQDGANDLVVGSDGMDYNGSNSGSVYLIKSHIILGYQGTGNVATVSNPSTYTVRIDGPQAGASFGNSPTTISDVNSDGKIDIVATAQTTAFNGRSNSGAVYVVDNSTFANYSGTGNTLNVSISNNYRYRIEGPASSSYLSYVIGVEDFDYDTRPDFFFSSYNGTATGKSNAGGGYVIYNSLLSNYDSNGNTLDLSNLNNSNVRYAGASINNYDYIRPIGDVNGDGRVDLAVFGSEDYNGTDSGSVHFIYNFPHQIMVDDVNANIADNNLLLIGSVSALKSITNISGVEWSFENVPTGTWTSCTANDGVFDSTYEEYTCDLSELLEDRNYSIFLRSFDENHSYTARSGYKNVIFTIDTTNPKLIYSVVDSSTGRTYDKKFLPTSISNLSLLGDTHYPKFCFTRGYDEGSGVSHYAVVVDGTDYLSNIPYTQPPVGDNGDTRKEGESIVKENNSLFFEYHLYDDIAKQQEICAYGKSESHYLEAGIHKWFVKAIDNAGNSTSTETRRFLVMTNQGVQSKPNQSVWFPLTLSQVGNKTNLLGYNSYTSELFSSLTTPISFTDTTPTFYGIAPVGTKIELTLYQDTKDSVGVSERKQVSSFSTTANQSSEWGINLTTPLTTGTYYLTIQATDTSDNFAILKDIPIKLTTAQVTEAVLGATTQATAESISEAPSPTVMQPTPTTKPLPTPTPTPKPFCLWKWCW